MLKDNSASKTVFSLQKQLWFLQ